MEGSSQKWVGRNRPPRVQITYDLETGGAIEKKELPLVVGILADLAGSGKLPLPKDRKFIEIDRDNFNDVMASLKPRLEFATSKFSVDLTFKEIGDLRPEAIVQQTPELRQLFEARQKLNDLIAKLDGNAVLDDLLQKVAKNTEEQKNIKKAAAEEEKKKIDDEAKLAKDKIDADANEKKKSAATDEAKQLIDTKATADKKKIDDDAKLAKDKIDAAVSGPGGNNA